MFNRLITAPTAVRSYSGVVKRWECDHNGHWNMQFYMRGFQMASEVLATLVTGTNPGARSADLRHYRFHREVFCPEAMYVLSSRIAEGPLTGSVLHRMLRGGDRLLSATAIERPGYPVDALPFCTAEELRPALSRGLAAVPHDAAGADGAEPGADVIGILRPADLDHLGEAQCDVLAALCTGSSHGFLSGIGLTTEWVRQNNCNRMAVEMSFKRHAPCRLGDMLATRTRVSTLGHRHFTLCQQIVDGVTGAPRATLEKLMLMIDLDTRKPVGLPDLLRGSAHMQGGAVQ